MTPASPATRQRTKPGSVAHAIATTVREESLRLGHGLTAEEAREACAARGITSPTFNAQFFSMVRRDVLIAVGGRASRTEYAHSEAPVPPRAEIGAEEDDDAALVFRALVSAVRRLGRWVTTREVTAELRDLGLRLRATHPNAVRTTLATLSRERQRGHGTWAAPRVLRADGKLATGASAVRWCPVGLEVPNVDGVPSSESEALRRLVRIVEQDLPGPASLFDLRLWLLANGNHPLATVLKPNDLGRVIDFTVQVDRKAKAGAPGRLQVIDGRLACHGGAPTRYAIEPTVRGTTAVALEDALRGYRPQLETDQIEALRRRAARLDVPILAAYADARERALRAAFAPILAGDGMASASTVQARLKRRREWLERAPLTHDAKWARAENDRVVAAGLPAVSHLASRPTSAAVAAPGAPLAGEAGTGTFPALAPFITAAARELGVADARRAALLRGVRRFPNPEGEGIDRWGEGAQRDLLTLVDRVEALVALYAAVQVPRPNALIQSAHELLGVVLRDVGEVAKIAAATHRTDESTWRAAAVAMGLLGVSPLALPRPLSDDPWNPRALILGTTLADPGAAAKALWTAGAPRWAGAGEVVDLAMRRLELGRLMTVIG